MFPVPVHFLALKRHNVFCGRPMTRGLAFLFREPLTKE